MTEDFIADLKGYILREHKSPREAWCDPDDVQAALDEIERLRAALREIEYLSRRQVIGSPNRKTIHQIAFHVITGDKTDD